MSDEKCIDFGPLAGLIGVWKGDKGIDIAPEPAGSETNPYYETLTFSPVGDVTNADSQTLSVLHYRQLVQRKSDDSIFHDETGYWMWDEKQGIIMHSLVIPRAVAVLAGGQHSGNKEADGGIVLQVHANIESEDWKIIQSPFMQDNARTIDFQHRINIKDGVLSYAETTVVEIYDKVFEHTDQNELMLQSLTDR